jgi:hypothetical protein
VGQEGILAANEDENKEAEKCAKAAIISDNIGHESDM